MAVRWVKPQSPLAMVVDPAAPLLLPEEGGVYFFSGAEAAFTAATPGFSRIGNGRYQSRGEIHLIGLLHGVKVGTVEGIVVGFSNMQETSSALPPSTNTKFLMVVDTPLKKQRGGFKDMSEVRMVRAGDVVEYTSGPNLEILDIDGFVSRLDLFKDLNLGTPLLVVSYASSVRFADKLKRTEEAAKVRIERYCATYLAGQTAIASLQREARHSQVLKLRQELAAKYGTVATIPWRERLIVVDGSESPLLGGTPGGTPGATSRATPGAAGGTPSAAGGTPGTVDDAHREAGTQLIQVDATRLKWQEATALREQAAVKVQTARSGAEAAGVQATTTALAAAEAAQALGQAKQPSIVGGAHEALSAASQKARELENVFLAAKQSADMAAESKAGAEACLQALREELEERVAGLDANETAICDDCTILHGVKIPSARAVSQPGHNFCKDETACKAQRIKWTDAKDAVKEAAKRELNAVRSADEARKKASNARKKADKGSKGEAASSKLTALATANATADGAAQEAKQAEASARQALDQAERAEVVAEEAEASAFALHEQASQRHSQAMLLWQTLLDAHVAQSAPSQTRETGQVAPSASRKRTLAESRLSQHGLGSGRVTGAPEMDSDVEQSADGADSDAGDGLQGGGRSRADVNHSSVSSAPKGKGAAYDPNFPWGRGKGSRGERGSYKDKAKREAREALEREMAAAGAAPSDDAGLQELRASLAKAEQRAKAAEAQTRVAQAATKAAEATARAAEAASTSSAKSMIDEVKAAAAAGAKVETLSENINSLRADLATANAAAQKAWRDGYERGVVVGKESARNAINNH